MYPEQNLSSGTCVRVRGKADNAHPLLLQSCCCCKLARAVGTAGALAWRRQDLCQWATNLHWCQSYLVLRTTSLASQNQQDLFACCWSGRARASSKTTSNLADRTLMAKPFAVWMYSSWQYWWFSGESNVTRDNFLKGSSSWWSWPLTGTQPGSDWPILLGMWGMMCLAVETEPSLKLNPKTFFWDHRTNFKVALLSLQQNGEHIVEFWARQGYPKPFFY